MALTTDTIPGYPQTLRYNKFYVECKLPNGYTITSNWKAELQRAAIQFLTSNAFPFYQFENETTLIKTSATAIIQDASDRVNVGIPFTRFAMLDPSGKFVGECALEFGANPHKLQIASRVQKKIQNQSVESDAITFLLNEYLPRIHLNFDMRVPVLTEGQDHVKWHDKKIREWVNLRDVSIETNSHPNNQLVIKLLETLGFQKTKDASAEVPEVGNKQTIKTAKTENQKRRNVYEIAVTELLKQGPVCPYIFSSEEDFKKA